MIAGVSDTTPGRDSLDARIFRAARAPKRSNWLGAPALLVGGLLAFELFGGTRTSDSLMTNAAWYGVLGIGFYIAYALGGIFSFGLAGFVALGAYVSAYFTRADGLDLPWGIGCLLAAIICAAAGLLLALLLGNAHAFAFAIGSLAYAEIIHTVVRSWSGFTGDQAGFVVNIPRLSLGGEMLDSTQTFRLMLLALVMTAGVALIFQRAPFRRELIAGRDGHDVAIVLGLPAARLRLIAFTLSSALTGFGGGVYAHWRGTLTPDSFNVSLTLTIFLMVVIGGIRTMWGIVPGVVFVVYLPQLVSFSEKLPALLYGLSLLVVIIAFPGGILSGFGGVSLAEWARRLQRRARRDKRPA